MNPLIGLTGYVYDAEGRRVEKVIVNGYNTQHPTTTVEDAYLLGLNGEQVTVLDNTGNWQWTNVYANGKVLATYSRVGVYHTTFALTDWLGSKRMGVAGGPFKPSVGLSGFIYDAAGNVLNDGVNQYMYDAEGGWPIQALFWLEWGTFAS